MPRDLLNKFVLLTGPKNYIPDTNSRENCKAKLHLYEEISQEPALSHPKATSGDKSRESYKAKLLIQWELVLPSASILTSQA